MKAFAIAVIALTSFAPSAIAQNPDTFVNTGKPQNGVSALAGSKNIHSLAVPAGTPVMLVSLESVSSDTATAGSPVYFAVARDVVVDGTILIPAGEPVTGTIAHTSGVQAPSHNGHLIIRINRVPIGNGTGLRLISSNPTTRRGPFRAIGDTVTFAAVCVVYFPLCIAMQGIAHQGRDYGAATIPHCGRLQFFTESAATVVVPPNTEPPQASIPTIEDICPDPHVAFTAYVPGVKFN